tara:strand:- start:601 stop:1323 length:723 start_codon:yes stop_codon:yes gene_type:complete
MDREPQYEIKNISKSFYHDSWKSLISRKKIIALKNININFNEGDRIGILGKNGSGKSTLLKIVGNIILADQAEFTYVNKNIITSYVSGNERSFFWRLTVRENLDFFCKIYGVNKEYASKKINELAKDFNIQDFLDLKFMTLSTGMKKRISIVRALLKNPDIFLFDEITNSLDLSSTQKILNRVKDLGFDQQKKIIFWATHDYTEVIELCDKAIILDRGDQVKIINRGEKDFNEKYFKQLL